MDNISNGGWVGRMVVVVCDSGYRRKGVGTYYMIAWPTHFTHCYMMIAMIAIISLDCTKVYMGKSPDLTVSDSFIMLHVVIPQDLEQYV